MDNKEDGTLGNKTSEEALYLTAEHTRDITWNPGDTDDCVGESGH